MIKSTDYIKWLKEQAALKRPYWYGTFGHKCTETLLASKRQQYPTHYTAARMAKYRQHIAAGLVCADCVGGAIKWPVWSDLDTHKVVYKSNDCPDLSANGMFNHCKKLGMTWGGIKTLPEIPGLAVHRSGHVGTYIGGGKVVEWRGFNYGCVITDVSKRNWTHWYKLPWVEYISAAAPQPEPAEEYSLQDFIRDVQQATGAKVDGIAGPETLGVTVTLSATVNRKHGAVKPVQRRLAALGYAQVGTPDGIAGPKFSAAVKAFQTANGCVSDGEITAGAKTWRKLLGMQ